MTNITPELIAKIKAAESAEELLELAKANDVELTAEEAKTYFEQLHTNGAISDDDLENVAGGFVCEAIADFLLSRSSKFDGGVCRHCSDKPTVSVSPSFDSSITPLPYTTNDEKQNNNKFDTL